MGYVVCSEFSLTKPNPPRPNSSGREKNRDAVKGCGTMMDRENMNQTTVPSRTLLDQAPAVLTRFGAVVVFAYYMASAHLTRGHEADFGKQWLAARLIVTGRGHALFDLATQRRELERHFSTKVIDHGIWRAGVGGPTYPPVQAVLFAPLGWLEPASAQALLVRISLMLCVVTAWCISRLTERSVSMATALLAILVFPAFFFNIGVGQNAALSLTILTGGWLLAIRGFDVWAGVVWGIFAFKPTWGIAVAWVPLALGRPRIWLGMAISGLLLVVATIPVCGFHAWLQWLHVARQTEHYYETLPRWIGLSRDLPGLVRRVWMGSGATALGWLVVTSVAAAVVWWTRDKQFTGPIEPRCSERLPSTVVLFGVVLSCPRFMFYDMTLAVLPALLLLGEWSKLHRHRQFELAVMLGLFWTAPLAAFLAWDMVGWPLETIAVALLAAWAVARRHAGASDVVQVAVVRPIACSLRRIEFDRSTRRT